MVISITSLRWDKLSTWRRKLDEYEMADAVPYCGRAMNRSASAIQADVQRVALLRTGLLNISLPAESLAALESHLAAPSSSLHREMEQSGQSGMVSPPSAPVLHL